MVFALLIVLILVEVMTVFAVLASQRSATEQALREYSHELLKNVIDETRENAAAYLRQAQDSVALGANVFEAGLLAMDDATRVERFFLEQLRVVPQLDGLYFGDQQGNFIFTKRDDESAPEGFMTKLIAVDAAESERITVINRDRFLKEIGRERQPTDAYDPRTRPWYETALARSGEIWTQPYIFFTSQQPGLTVARGIWKTGDPSIAVVGADIELSALSEFLKTQRIGSAGAAFIIDRNGSVIAHPQDTPLATRDNGTKLRLKQLGELDPVTAQAGVHLADRFPDLDTLDRTHYDKFELDGRFYLSMFTPLLDHPENRWLIGVYAPEDELAVKIREGQRESVFLGVAASLLVITAAVLIGLVSLRPINRLQREAGEDPLTGLLNRRSFDELAERRLQQAQKRGTPVSALMVDIDRFKPINDDHGHPVGDEVLIAVARRIGRGLSERDLLARYGGEEFAIMLADTTLEQARLVAERLRTSVSETPIKTSKGKMQMTVSIWVTQYDPTLRGLSHLLERADHGMLEAKRDGRDQVNVVEGQPA
jgi:diguanylate cyclase (GGDEF)-like protein